METGSSVRLMVLDSLDITKGSFVEDSGQMINSMAWVSSIGRMELYLKECFIGVQRKKVNLSGPIEVHMMEILWIINSKEKEFSFGRTIRCIEVSGKTI